MTDIGKCRSCGARVLWKKMAATGRPNPLNAEPDPVRGNVLIIRHESAAAMYGGEIGQAVALKRDDLARERAAGRELYLSHFATCPNRGQHRRAEPRRDPSSRGRVPTRRAAE